MSLATLPSAIGAWSIARITAGLWLSESAGPVPAAVLGLPAEAGRPNVAVDADAPSPGTDRLLAELFPVLSSAGLTTVRLVLSSAADRYAPAAQAHGLDLIAAEAEVTITPHGYAVVRPAGSLAPGAAPQWRRCRCPKYLYLLKDGKRRTVSAKTRSWDKAENKAQEIRDAWDPVQQKMRNLSS